MSDDKTCCINNEVTGISFDSKIKTYVRTPEGYSVEKLGDKSGGTLNNYTTLNFTQCIDTCKNTEECVGISYKSGACELKQANGMASSYSDTTKQFIKNNNPKAKSYQFHNSVLPSEGATIIDVGELGWGQTYNVPEIHGDQALWYLQLQTDGNLVWVKRGTGTQWHIGSHTTMPNTKVYLQGDGNVCAYGDGGTKCTMSHDPDVPSGQHKLVLKSNGEMYVDHGNGRAARNYIYQP